MTEAFPPIPTDDLVGSAEDEDERSDESVVAALSELFDRERQRVRFSRQVEVIHEDRWFHWMTNRALRSLIEDGSIVAEERALATGGAIRLMWHRSYRYPKRDAARVVAPSGSSPISPSAQWPGSSTSWLDA
ncbi:MAG: hypothetical protein ACRD29_05925 [Acidimicrobiales bacterium]